MDSPKTKDKKKLKLHRFLKILGPGLITGAADDDPSGIATYSQTGAQFGFGQLWSVIFLYPLMTAVQEACARIGAVTKKGIAAVVKDHYGKKILFVTVAMIAIANIINIGADLGAMAAATELIIPLPLVLITLFFTALMLCAEIFMAYRSYVHILKWLALSLFVYPLTVFIINAPWGEILRATFLPHLEFSFGFFFIFIGVIGTTISPYMFFWQASEEVEEEINQKLPNKESSLTKFLRRMRADNAIGMLLSQIITWCIIIVTGTVLHQSGVTNIATAADAAKALVPLVNTFPNAGLLAEIIFAVGIVGLGLLAVPVLAGSAAYAVAEAFNWHEGLYRKFREAHGFYYVIIIATLIGLLMNFVGINPMKALVVTAVINGVISVPLVFLIIKISSSSKIMGQHKSGPLSKIFLWITFVAILASALSMLFLLR